MSEGSDTPHGPIFPPWLDRAVKVGGALAAVGLVYLVAVGAYAVSPKTIDVGYAPEQPVAYSHAVHVGQLGMDCRYCHNTVEETAHASIPPTQTCKNCHTMVLAESEKMFRVRESFNTGTPIPWIRVHDLPDYVYFDHSAHVARGVGCTSCHGRVDRMEVITQVEPLSMGWCLDCHRNPEAHIRPKDQVTVMDWVPEEEPETLGERLAQEYGIDPSTDCSTCHR